MMEKIDQNSNMDGVVAAGRYELCCLPEYAAASVAATLEPGIRSSFLTIGEPKIYERNGLVRVSFDHPNCVARGNLADRVSAQVIDVSDELFPKLGTFRMYQTKLKVVVGTYLFAMPVWLTGLEIRSTPLVMGRGVFSQYFSPDPGSSFLLGKPKHPIIDLCVPAF